VQTAPDAWCDGYPTVAYLMAQTVADALIGVYFGAVVPSRVARTLHALRSRADGAR
jgi:hypothetical protein